MSKRRQKALAAMTRAVQRATDRPAKQVSRQPRFQARAGAFGSVYRWLQLAEIELPAYCSDSRARDKRLREIWRLEPRLAGVVNTVVLVDSNRGWELVGGRNQVRRYTDVLHAAEAGQGWRTFVRKLSLSYWATDLGAVAELGRDGEGGPLRALYHVDSARCRLTGRPEAPLEYQPLLGGVQPWGPRDFVRAASMPSDDEAFHGLGWCAVSRCIEVARILYAVLLHDQEQLAARAPRGLMLLQNISQDQWDQAMEAREEKLESLERRYYGGVAVLAAMGMEAPDAKLVALSQLPANFDERTFMDLSMYAYALCFGYDPREFWPVSSGALGTATETEAQHRKATGKGGLEFPLSLQEGMQQELPPTLEFGFEQRDDEGELATTAVKQAKALLVKTIYESGMLGGNPLVDRSEARQLAAEDGLIPPEWTETEEDVTATDTEAAESEADVEAAPGGEPAPQPGPEPPERWLDRERVRRAMERFPEEEIVRYRWPSRELRVLWRPRATPRFHPAAKRRQDDPVLYEGGGVRITQADVDQAVAEARRREPEMAELLEAPEYAPAQGEA